MGDQCVFGRQRCILPPFYMVFLLWHTLCDGWLVMCVCFFVCWISVLIRSLVLMLSGIILTPIWRFWTLSWLWHLLVWLFDNWCFVEILVCRACSFVHVIWFKTSEFIKCSENIFLGLEKSLLSFWKSLVRTCQKVTLNLGFLSPFRVFKRLVQEKSFLRLSLILSNHV